MERLMSTILGMIVFGGLWYLFHRKKKEPEELKKETIMVTVIFGVAYYVIDFLW